jgi:hypothetical protein
VQRKKPAATGTRAEKKQKETLVDQMETAAGRGDMAAFQTAATSLKTLDRGYFDQIKQYKLAKHQGGAKETYWRAAGTAGVALPGLAPAAAPAPRAAPPPVRAPQPAQAADPDVEPQITPVDDFAGHAKGRFGVGEQVRLAVTITGGTAAGMGGLRWETKTGPATVTTPNTDGTATASFDHQDGPVTFSLKVATGARTGEEVATKRVQVVKPRLRMDQHPTEQGLAHRNGRASCGFVGIFVLEPADVSFRWVRFREGYAPPEATGRWAGVTWKHPLNPGTTGGWNSVRSASAPAHGIVNAVDSSDRVYSGGHDVAGGPGTFQWSISWYCRVGNQEWEVTKAVHSQTVDNAGTVAIEKKVNGQGPGPFTRAPGDATHIPNAYTLNPVITV